MQCNNYILDWKHVVLIVEFYCNGNLWNTGTFTITQLFACNNTGLYDQALKDVFCAHWIYMYMYCLHWWKFDVTFFITIFWHLVNVPLFFSFLCYLLIKTFCVKKKHKQCLSHVIFRFKDSINKIMIVFSLILDFLSKGDCICTC